MEKRNSYCNFCSCTCPNNLNKHENLLFKGIHVSIYGVEVRRYEGSDLNDYTVQLHRDYFHTASFFYFSEKCFWKKKNLTGVKVQKRAVDSVSPYLRWNDSVQDTTD